MGGENSGVGGLWIYEYRLWDDCSKFWGFILNFKDLYVYELGDGGNLVFVVVFN